MRSSIAFDKNAFGKMVNDFDKEIDAMLRDLAKNSQSAFPNPHSIHLDADEISAFAENALPKIARGRATEHLADCSKCRKILANTIFLNSAEESETIHEEVKTVVSAPIIPWYKKIFVFPNLSYAMGAMALLLVGMIGFLVVQNSNNPESTVAQIEKAASEKSSGPNLGSSEGDASTTQPFAANSTANSPAAMATPTQNAANSAASNVAVPKDAPAVADSNSSSVKPTDSEFASKSKTADDVTEAKKDSSNEPPKPAPTPAKEELIAEKGGEGALVNSRQVQDLPVQSRNTTNQVMMPDGQNRANIPSPPSLSSSGSGQETTEKERSAPAKPSKKVADRDNSEAKNRTVETRKIGNKSFRNVNGIWTDTSYSGGATQNVKRNSDEFKKLDSGLQNTANSLGGTVIIVWGGKNYKIQ